jgi:3-methyladenine DNA glycosylase Tag
LKVPVPRAQSPAQLQTPWTRLTESFAKFNLRWQAYVAKFPRDEINEIRDGYNRYYVLEKECATGSAALARRGFVELPPVTVQTLLQWYPLLPVFTLT